MATYFEAVRAKTFEKVLPLYDKRFFEKTDRDTWLKMLAGVNKKLGDLQSYKLVNWRSQGYTGIGSYPSGTYYVLIYNVVYSKHPAQETITVFQGKDGHELKVVGHNINSPGLLTE